MKKLSFNEIRKTWLSFFESKGHVILESKSLIPIDDNSLLWINSGVATLKKYFSGEQTPICNRLANSQRAIRTNDIENVGNTSRHHTFFEMLGNFSIGDYFKKEAIDFAFEILTKKFGFESERLYITVFEDDETTYNQWINKGISSLHIVRANKERNFWEIGQGPCGPCTEIYYDRGSKYDPNNIGEKLFFNDIENDRYVEIWNIVFSQYNNDGNGNYTELTRKNIDTGAGLERLAAVIQDVPTNFDTDVFQPIINSIESLSKFKYDINSYFDANNKQQKDINRDFKIIADHLKACTFAIADGVHPSNKERGSIIRRLIRRAMVCARRLKIETKFTALISKAVIKTMTNYYPYLVTKQDEITNTLTKEEELFAKTLENGYKLFEQALIQNKNELPTDTIFRLVDTYGFPFEIIQELAKENNLAIDIDAYKQRFNKHQDVSRANIETKGMLQQHNDLINFTQSSTFDYEKSSINGAKIIGLFDLDFKKVDKISNGYFITDTTCFYATSGGQVCDNGYAIINGKQYAISNVSKTPNNQHLHLVDAKHETLTINQSIDLFINQINRKKTSANHTVEHLLQYILIKYISQDIQQEGAFKSSEKVTFDFHYNKKITDEQLKLIQLEVNKLIQQSLHVKIDYMSLAKAKEYGALAWFEDVYSKIKGDLRVITIGNLSKEICGGTHVSNTKEIEEFMIVKLISKGDNAYRIEAITTNSTINEYLHKEISLIKSEVDKMINDLKELKINDESFADKVNNLKYDINQDNFNQLKTALINLQKEFHLLTFTKQKLNIEQTTKDLIEQQWNFSTSKAISYCIASDLQPKAIINALSTLAKINKNVTYVLFNLINPKVQYYVYSFAINAQEFITKINELLNGTGGGKMNFAQGGSANDKNLQKTIDYLKQL